MKFAINSAAVPLIAVAVLALGAPTASAIGSDEPRTVSADRVLLISDSVRMAPQPPQLSEEEKQAVADKKAGRPYDEAAFNRAKKKRIQAENITRTETSRNIGNRKITAIADCGKMSVARYTAFHFSQSNPQGAGQESVPALLRRVADTIDKLGDVSISNLILHPALTSDGDDWPSVTVYYHDRADVQ